MNEVIRQARMIGRQIRHMRTSRRPPNDEAHDADSTRTLESTREATEQVAPSELESAAAIQTVMRL